MPTFGEHISKYEHDKNFFSSIKSIEYPDWAVIVLFYRSVHLLESVMATLDQHSGTHDERKMFMNDNCRLFPKDVKKRYRELESLSRSARYVSEIKITSNSVDTAQLCEDEIYSWFNSIKQTL